MRAPAAACCFARAPAAAIRIAFCPPLIITESEVDMLFDRWELALDDTLAHVRAEGWM